VLLFFPFNINCTALEHSKNIGTENRRTLPHGDNRISGRGWQTIGKDYRIKLPQEDGGKYDIEWQNIGRENRRILSHEDCRTSESGRQNI
jgi:hypothetical protein